MHILAVMKSALCWLLPSTPAVITSAHKVSPMQNFASQCSVGHFEGRAVLRAVLAPVVNAGCGDIRMSQPFLHLGDVGAVVERIGGSGRAQGMRPEAGSVDL